MSDLHTRPLPAAPTPDRRAQADAATPDGGASPLIAVLVALAAVAGIVLTWHVLVLSPRGQQLDDAAVDGALYGQGRLWQLAEPVLDVVSVGFVVVVLGVAMVLALLRRRWGLAVQVAVLVIGANVTTQVLKHAVLERPDLGHGTGNSLPSGHTTVAAAVSVALLMVAPRRARPVVALVGAAYTGATGVATMVGQWHRPSDVLAAILVVLAWTGLVCALTSPSERDERGGSAVATSLTCGLLVLAALVAGAAGWAIITGAELPLIGAATASGSDVRAYVGMAAIVTALTAAAFALVLLLRQVTARR